MIQQGTEEWLLERCGHVTGSRAADVLATIKSGEAAARRNYRAQLVLERILRRPCEDGFVSKAMEVGTEREPVARSWYMDRTDALVQKVGFLKHPTHAWVGCSLDGRVEGNGILEIKCPQPAKHMMTLMEGTMSYTPQVQFNIWVAGADWCDFVSYNPDFPENLRGCLRRIERDQKYIDSLEKAVLEFDLEVQQTVVKLLEMKA